MNLDEVLSPLGLRDSLEILQPHWEESVAGLPAPGPSFLDPDEITAHRALVGLPPEVEPFLLETARQVRGNPALLHLIWHCHQLLYEHRDYPGNSIARWPGLEV